MEEEVLQDVAEPQPTEPIVSLPSLDEVIPISESVLEERQRLEQEEQQRPSVAGAVAAGFENTVTASIMRDVFGRGFEPDLDFVLTEEEVTALAQQFNIPARMVSQIGNAQSQEELDYQLEFLSHMASNEQALANLGWTGAGISIVTGILDPAAIAATLATDGIAGSAIWGRRAAMLTRLQRAGRLGTYSAATEGTMMAYAVAENPVLEAQDAINAAGLAFLLGGALGGILPGGTPAEANAVTRQFMQHTQTTGIAPHTQPFNPATLNTTTSTTALNAGATIPNAPLMAPGSGGAARAAVNTPISDEAEDALRQVLGLPETTPTWNPGNRSRLDMAGSLGASENPLIRYWGSHTVQDAVGKADRTSINPWSATEDAAETMRRFLVPALRTSERQFRLWRRAQGRNIAGRVNPVQYIRDRRAFEEEIGRAVRDRNNTSDPHVLAAAEAHADAYEAYITRLTNHLHDDGGRGRAIQGFGGLSANRNYLPRIYSYRRIEDLRKKFGDNLDRFMARSLQAGDATLTPEAAERIARHMVRTLRRAGVGERISKYAGMGEEARDEVLSVLRSELNGQVSVGDMEYIADLITDLGPRANQVNSPTPRGKVRAGLDESYAEDQVQGIDGFFYPLRMDDLFENNATWLLESYSRQISGHIALAKKGIFSRADWDQAMNTARQADTLINRTRGDLDSEIQDLQRSYDYLTGKPLYDMDERGVRIMDRIRRYNFMRVMNQVGLAQLSELGNSLVAVGFRRSLANLPALSALWRRAKNGDLPDDVLRDIELYLGFNSLQIRGRTLTRMDDADTITSTGMHTMLDDLLQMGGHFTSRWSGLAPLTDAMQAMTARGLIHKLADLAATGKTLPRSRMAQLGIDDAMWQRVVRELTNKRNVIFSRGITGRRLQSVGLDNWTDLEARSAFLHAIDRETRRAIQENDIGNMRFWMSSPMAQLILQFRMFSIVSLSKQTMSAAHHRDTIAALSVMYSSIFGGLGYVAQQIINTTGMEDQREILEERLTVPKLAAAAFYRSAYSSLIPNAIDFGAQAAGYDPLFSPFRQTGLSNDIIFGNPTTDLLNTTAKGLLGVGAAAIDPNRDLTTADLNNLRRAALWGNFWGVRNGLELIAGPSGLDLPDRN